MGIFIEAIETYCKCELSKDERRTSYIIEAQVTFVPAIGRRLKICINPPLNSVYESEMIFDGSKLPRAMIKDWLTEHLEDYNLYSIRVLESDIHENPIEIVN